MRLLCLCNLVSQSLIINFFLNICIYIGIYLFISLIGLFPWRTLIDTSSFLYLGTTAMAWLKKQHLANHLDPVTDPELGTDSIRANLRPALELIGHWYKEGTQAE